MSLRLRRGGGEPLAPPPPGAAFGPTLGAASVRSDAGPRTVNSPGTGISFNSSASLQSAINANVAGSTFVCATNTPVWSGQVGVGTKNPTIIFPGTPGQCIIDGGGGDFIGINGPTGGSFTVKGGTFRNFGTTTWGIGINALEACLVEDVITTDCYVCGIQIQGSDTRVSHCRVYDNGQDGVNTISGSLNTVIEYCDIYGNNTRQISPGTQGGAGKAVATGNGWYHHNWVHDNLGFGAWWDTNNWDWLIEENVLELNYYSGLFWEANYGSVFRRNYIANNGRGIVVGTAGTTFTNMVNVRLSDNSADRVNPNGVVTPVDFSQNIVDDDGTRLQPQTGGLLIIWDHSAGAQNRYAANHDIHDNQFWLRNTSSTGRLGGQDTATTGFPVWSLDNNFFSNQYRVAQAAITSNLALGKWDTGTGQGTAQTYSAWQGFQSGDNIARVPI